MFWTEEDIMPAILSTQKVFGKQNIYHYDRNYKFVSVVTAEFGKIWTGEIDFSIPVEVQNKLNILSDTLNKRIYITEDSYELDMALVKSITKLKEMTDIVT